MIPGIPPTILEAQLIMPMQLRQAIDRYLDLRRSRVSANTYANDRVALSALAETFGPHRDVRCLTREAMDDKFFGPDGMAFRTSAATFNSYLSRMRRFTSTAVAYGWLGTDPLLGMEGRRREAPKDRQRLEPAELLALVEAARSPRDRIALAIAVNTGLRASEISTLRVGDVDLAKLTLTVLISKTGPEFDHMPITAHLEKELSRWLTHYRKIMSDGDLHSDWYLVPQQSYAPRHLSEDRTYDYLLRPHKPVLQPYDIVKRALEDCGLPTQQEGFHTIRRSVGRAYYELMKSKVGHESALVATAALLHHRDIRQTQHYIGVKPERLERDTILRGRPFLELAGDTPRRLRAVGS